MKPRYDKVLTATETIDLGDADDNTVSRWIIQVQDEGSMNFSIAVKGAILGSDKVSPQNGGGTALTRTDLEYRNLNTGTDVSGATAITAAGKYMIDSSGMAVSLVATRTGGSARITAIPVRG